MRLPLTISLVPAICFFTMLSATAQEIKIHPLSEISDGPLPMIVNLGAKSAGLTFKSSIPVACTVVYGTSPAFGMIANDPDMSSVATIDHNPVIGKLQSQTKYYFRVQGISATGKLYAGNVRSFTTPAAVALSGGVKVLATKIAGVSSNYGNGKNSGSWGADSAVDGDPSTAWSSNGDGSKAFLTLDLGKPVNVGWVSVWTRTMSDGTAQMNTFTITTDRGKKFGPFTLPDAKAPYRFPLETKARTLRLDAVTSSGGNTGLIEIQVLGPIKK